MAWPPVLPIVGEVEAKIGTLPTTIAWGTDGILSGAIVISCRAVPLQEEIQIPNGSGITATDIMLNDGEQVEITVVDDRSLSFPDWGAVITLIDPRATGTSGTSASYTVISNDYNAERKREGQRSLLCKRYNLITPS